ncbi:hypothetical protein H632_c3683p0, partial [Helicosporidium sp. ATCC 50920]
LPQCSPFLPVNKSQTLLAYGAKRPSLASEVFVAPSASVIGDVKIGSSSSVWYGAVVRGDVGSVSIGSHTSIQDNAMVHVARHNAQNLSRGTAIGSHVTVGHGAVVHAATLEDGCFVGAGATVMDGATVERGAVLAAGALLAPGATVPAGEVWAGVPAKKLRGLAPGEQAYLASAAEEYSALARVHAGECAKGFNAVELDSARREDRRGRDPAYDAQNGVARDPETREVTNA